MEGKIGECMLYMDLIQAYYNEGFEPKFPGFEI